jgi:RimJ/RimL family protein N-acetyltransferase/predicted GNAT family acetyltransferase
MSDPTEPSSGGDVAQIDVINNPVNQQFEAVRFGKVIGVLSYRWISVSHVELEHMYVAPRERGHNVGALLVEHAIGIVRSKGGRLAPTCSYVTEYIQRHPEHAELLAPPVPRPRRGFDAARPEAFVHDQHEHPHEVRLELLQIRTPRIVLRAWDLDDTEVAYELFSHPSVTRWMRPAVPQIASRDKAGQVLDRWIAESNRAPVPQGRWAIERQDTGKVIGSTHLTTPTSGPPMLTLWWHVAPEAAGEGFASEAAHAVAHHAFSVEGVDRLYALIEPANDRAIGTATRIGMRSDGTTSEYYGTTLNRYRLDRPDLEEAQERRSLSLTD